MSARVAPLVEIADLCKEFDAMLFVDDAHGTGVFGDSGRGIPEMLGVEDRLDFWVGSTAQGLGVRGGYIAGPKELMDYLRLSARRYVFSGTLPAGIPAAVSQALATASEESNGFSGQAAQPKEFNLKLGAERLSRSAQQAAEPRFFDTFRPTGLDNTFAVACIGEIGKAR